MLTTKSTRRVFLSRAIQGSAFLSLGFGLPRPFRNDLFAGEKPAAGDTGRVLVVLEMAGGNDGLNTVIPFTNDLYYKARPVLAVKPDRVVKLSDEYGLHPDLAALKPLWDAGRVAIVHGVGYPNPDRSHFRSMEIWHTARPDLPEGREVYGWLGRTLDRENLIRRARMPAVNVGREPSLALQAATASVPCIADPASYGPAAVSPTERTEMGAMARRPAGGGNPTLDYLRKASQSAFLSAEELSRMARDYKSAAPYPATGIGQGFKACAQILSAGLGARILYLTIGGFDTHAGQAPNHTQLFSWIGEAVSAFFKDLQAARREREVLVLAYSEFGRRVKENASAGTDHGAAGPMILVSGALKGGFHGAPPRLDRLTDGDLIHTTDFRSVYASVLERWLGFDSAGVLGGRWPQMDLFAAR